MTAIPNVALNNGVEIPQFGLGLSHVKPEETVTTVATAIDLGYRHFDTAQLYRNEAEVGEAIARSGLDRSEFFITSKLIDEALDFDAALAGFDTTLEALAVDVIDLFLIHWPLPTVRDFVPIWQAFERVYGEGRARAIGVSNFQIDHLRRLFDATEIVPAVNDIEAHPYFRQSALRAFGAEHGITTGAWSPIAKGVVLRDEVLAEIAGSHGKTTAQVVLRWHVQLGNVVFPKTTRPDRMRENLAIFDFVLSSDEMARIDALDRDQRNGPDPDTFAMWPPDGRLLTSDSKDWTWVIGARCPECGFDAAAISGDAVAALVRENAEAWRALGASGAIVADRPNSRTWSPLEYACHVRDVYLRYDERLRRMLEEDDPLYLNWDQDVSAIADRYGEQDVATVVGDLVVAALAVANRLTSVDGPAWSRPGRRSDGASFTVDSIARYMVHDTIHHIWDVTAVDR